MKYGVIDVGGGLRGIYGAGVLDRCLEEDLRFDLCIGVSAGSANMTSYLAGQHGRNKPFYDEYSFRREYMSVHNLIRKHSYLDLGYVYGTLSNAAPLRASSSAGQSWRLITAWSRVQVLPGPYEKRHPFGCLFCISRAFIPHPLRAAGSTGGVHITEHMIRWPFLLAPIAADPAFCRKLHQIPPFAQ